MFKAPAKDSNAPPIFNAVMSNKPAEVRRLIRNEGADVNMSSPGVGKTLLHFAAQLGNKEVVLVLLEEKAIIDAVTEGGFTPLHVAAQNGHAEVIAVLVNAGAKVNFPTKVGCTPLHEAAAKGHKQATLKLLELKADPAIKDNRYNLTPANLAHENGHSEVRDIIVAALPYQQSFIQNVNFVLFNWKRAFLPHSLEFQFVDKLSRALISIEDADEVFKKISAALKTPDYEPIKDKLATMRGLLIANMKRYNADKLEAAKPTSNDSPKPTI